MSDCAPPPAAPPARLSSVHRSVCNLLSSISSCLHHLGFPLSCDPLPSAFQTPAILCRRPPASGFPALFRCGEPESIILLQKEIVIFCMDAPVSFFLRSVLLSGQVVLPSAAAVLHARQRMLCDPAILLGHFMGHGSFIGSFCIQSKILLMHLMNSALIEQNSPSQVQKAIFSRVPAKFCLTKTYRKTTFDLRETNNIEYYRLLELAKIIYTQIGLNYLTRHCLFGSSMTSQNPSFIELNRNLTSANHLFLSPFRILPVPKQSISSIYFSACSKFTNE